jgi:hypothetical protein
VREVDGGQRLDFWTVVLGLVRDLPEYLDNRPLRVVDVYFSRAVFLNPLGGERIMEISRL